VAVTGFGANLPEDALYPTTDEDGDGHALDGTGGQSYTIHFEPGLSPPVNAFWSITLYDECAYLVANDYDKYTIHDTDGPHINTDGSLDIYLQAAPPSDPALEANWLPIPEAPFQLTLRMYWPQTSVLTGEWVPPPVVLQTAPVP
jgi:hypothetical protein